MDGENGGLAPDSGADFDVDALVDSIDQGSESYEIPMDDPAPAAPAEKPPAQAEPQTYTINVNGKEVKATLEQALKWAQQGYDYPQKMQALQKQREEMEQLQNRYKPFEEIDKYARENPEWWNHVTQSWEQRAQAAGIDQDNPLMKELNTLKAELNELRAFKDELKTDKLNQQRESEDKQLETEIKTMRDQYSYLDWSAVNENGHDLETQVLAYANQRGIGNFTDAFRAFNHDRLLSLAEERGKEAVSKDIQKKTKLGLLSGGSAPKKQVQETDVRGKSYETLYQEALEELNGAS